MIWLLEKDLRMFLIVINLAVLFFILNRKDLYSSINLNVRLLVVKEPGIVASSCNLQSTYRNWRKKDKANNFLDDWFPSQARHIIRQFLLFGFFWAKPVLYELQHFESNSNE